MGLRGLRGCNRNYFNPLNPFNPFNPLNHYGVNSDLFSTFTIHSPELISGT